MASDALSLLFKIKADSSDAQRDIKSLRNIFDSEVRGIETSGTSSFSKLGQSVGLTTTQMSGLAKATPFVAAGIAAIGGAAIAAGVALFNLTKTTAEFGSKINDASLKTGLSAETLSGLDSQLTQSGTSMEAFTKSVFMLQKNLETMADGSKKSTEALAKIGLKREQLGDTELVLRKVLAHLAAIPDEQERNARGAELMGRSYEQLAVFIADTNGNIDAVINSAREAGLVMSGESAKAADEFADKLDQVSAKAEGMGRTIGFIVMPAILDALNQIESAFKSIPDVVESATFGIKLLMQQYVIVPLQLAQLEIAKFNAMFGTMGSNVSRLVGEARTVMARQAAAFSGPDISGGAPTPRTTFPSGGGGGGGGGRRKATGQTDEERALQFLKQLEDQQNRTTATTELARVSLKLLEKGYNGLSDATREAIFRTAQAIDTDKAATKAKELLAKAVESIAKFTEAQNRELEASQGITRTAMDDVDDFLKSFEKLGEGKMHVLPIVEALMRLKALAIDGAAAVITLRDAMEGLELPGGPEGGFFGAPVDPNAPAGALEPPPEAQTKWQSLFETIVNGTGASQSAIVTFGAMARDALGGMVQGIGSMIQNWVLLGNTGPGAMKKMVASVLAGLAAQAAMYALFELAKGFAALFFNPAEAAAHFQAAALFGAVAIGAGIGGRALAGNSFQQGGGASAGASGGGGSTSGGATQGRETNIIDRERSNNQVDVRVRLDIASNDSHIVNTIVGNVRGNGEMRELIVGMVEA